MKLTRLPKFLFGRSPRIHGLLAVGFLLVGIHAGCRRRDPARVPAIETAKLTLVDSTAVPREPPVVDLAGQDEEIMIAVEAAAREVRRNPGQGEVWGQLGKVLLVHGFLKPAGFCLSTAARLDPSEVRWPYFLSSIVRETNRVAALAHLREAESRLNPRTTALEVRRAVRNRLAEALMEDNQPAAALTVLVPEPEERSADPGRELLKARCHFQLGQWADAQDRAAAVAREPDTRHDGLRLLAQLAQRRGDSAEARSNLVASAASPPWKRSDPLAAELEREARGLRAALQNGNQLVNAGRFAEARQLLTQTVLVHPHSAYAWLTLGKAEFAASRWTRAETCFRNAVENDPEMVEAHFQLGQALRAQGRLEDAVASFERGAQLKRDSVPAQYMLGLTLFELGRYEDAAAPFRICAECRPQSAEIQLRLARALVRSGASIEAEGQLASAHRLASADRLATNLLKEIEVEMARTRQR